MLFSVAQLNFGNPKHQADPTKVAEVMKNHHVALLSGCELGGKTGDRLTEELCSEVFGLRDITHKIPNGQRTRTFYDTQQVKLNFRIMFKISGQVKVGKGAGPDRLNPKYWVGGDFDLRLSNRNMRFGAEHLVASQWNPRRKSLAKKQVHKTVTRLDVDHDLLLTGMDGNNKWKSSTFNEFRRNGFTSDVEELGSPGNKKWMNNIDFIVYREAVHRIRPVHNYHVDVGSDHPMHVFVMDLRMKNG